jgi:hypothetical protein
MNVLAFERLLCRAIRTRAVVEFQYDGLHRVVHPYCHGTTRLGQESLRGVQVAGESRSGAVGIGKLWTLSKVSNVRITAESFRPDDPDYDPDDAVIARVHCRIDF